MKNPAREWMDISTLKKTLLWEWHFHKLLCEEMICLLPLGKNSDFVPHFFTQKFVKMPHLYPLRIFHLLHSPPGINKYFCIKKILHFNGNAYFLLYFFSTLYGEKNLKYFFLQWIPYYLFFFNLLNIEVTKHWLLSTYSHSSFVKLDTTQLLSSSALYS